jgi:predicted Zn finger-like uncharacterized protein
MATMITSCPECKKQIKVPAEIAGKKIKCKACGTIFVATSTAVRPKSGQPESEGKPKQPEIYKPVDDDEGDGKPYDITELDLTPRCPYCAHELDSEDQVICLNCGYNTMTRQMGQTRRIRDLSGWDWFWWLSPAILCVLLFSICSIEAILQLIWFLVLREEQTADVDPMARPCVSCCHLWLGIFCIWIMYLTAKFSIRRLIFHPRPPEEELH